MKIWLGPILPTNRRVDRGVKAAHDFLNRHRQARQMPTWMINETPLPRPNSSICSPSHIRNDVPAVRMIAEVNRNMNSFVTNQRLAVVFWPFSVRTDDHGLDDAQHHAGIARPLRDLAAAALAFFGDFLQRRHDGAEELKNDRGGNVGHDAQRKDGHLLQTAAGEHVQNAQNSPKPVPCALLIAPDTAVQIHARQRNEDADAGKDKQAQRPQGLSYEVPGFWRCWRMPTTCRFPLSAES